MTTDVTFLQTLVDERRETFLAEARTARLARLARRWRRVPAPPPPPPEKSAHAPRGRVAAAAGQ
ncbi:hypothetical protein [Pseudonocardia xishanensis]|uniref:Uncharacterized protein n=1 Tax=Pseudonocardia xishanensis TaxID=630995 RepID=A0ABP8RUG2_9PSEU